MNLASGSSQTMDWLLGNLHKTEVDSLNVVAVVWLDLWTGVEEAGIGGVGGSVRTYPRHMNWLFEALPSGGIHCSALILVGVGGGCSN